MNTHDILDTCIDAWVVLSRNGDRLRAEPIEGGPPIPPDLVQLLREHKNEVLALLDYMAEADALLLASTAGLATAWPAGCPLDSPEWEALEEAVTVAYWSESLANLDAALVDRDAYALDFFGAYRAERAT